LRVGGERRQVGTVEGVAQPEGEAEEEHARRSPLTSGMRTTDAARIVRRRHSQRESHRLLRRGSLTSPRLYPGSCSQREPKSPKGHDVRSDNLRPNGPERQIPAVQYRSGGSVIDRLVGGRPKVEHDGWQTQRSWAALRHENTDHVLARINVQRCAESKVSGGSNSSLALVAVAGAGHARSGRDRRATFFLSASAHRPGHWSRRRRRSPRVHYAL
jgi:hypothetical protein